MARRLLCFFLSAALLSGMFTGTAFGADATARTVAIFSAEGTVKMTKGTEKEFNAKAGLNLFDGYTVSTGENSFCYLKLDDDSLLKMSQKSKIKISKASKNKLSIAVLSGGLSVDAQPQQAGSTVEVSVGNSALSIRGTYFTAENNRQGAAVYTMFEGSGVVDGHDLPSKHVMNVLGDEIDAPAAAEDNEKNSASDQIHTLTPFKVDDSASIFVLETILSDTDRFIDGGLITSEDVATAEALLDAKLQAEQAKEPPEVAAGRALYYELITLGGYSTTLDLDAETVDKTILMDYLNLAYKTKSGIFVSTSADLVDAGRKWVMPEVMDTLNAAIRTAEKLLNATTTNREVNLAHTELGQALLAFLKDENIKIGTRPVSINTASLEDAISNAYAAKVGIFVSNDAASVDNRRQFATPEAMATLNTAIESAELVLNLLANFDEVQAEANSLNTAAAAFTSALGVGNNTENIIEERDDLEDAIASAYETKAAILIATEAAGRTALMSSVVISTNAKDIDEGKFWVTQADMDAMNAAIKSAEGVFSKTVTESETYGQIKQQILAEAERLQSATAAFAAAKKEGTRPLSVDRSPLNSAIERAYNAKTDVIATTSPENIFAGFTWVTPTEMESLNTAISTAEYAYINIVATADDVDAEVKALDTATAAFNAAKKIGTGPLDYARLISSIADAEATLQLIEDGNLYFISTNGRDIYWFYNWTTQAAYEALQDALANAYAALAGASTQQALQAAVDDISWESNVFIWSFRSGSKQLEREEDENAKAWRNTRTGVEFSNLINAEQASEDGDTLELFADTTVNYLFATDRHINFVINQDVSLTNEFLFTVAGDFTNNGTINNNYLFQALPQSTVTNNGTFINLLTTNIQGQQDDGSKSYDASEFINNGLFLNANGATLTVNGIFESSGTVSNMDGASINVTTVNETATLRFIGDNGFTNDAIITVTDGSILDYSASNQLVNGFEGVLALGSGGKFIYNSTSPSLHNKGVISFDGDIDIKTPMSLTGGIYATFIAPADIMDVANWDSSNLGIAPENAIVNGIPGGTYKYLFEWNHTPLPSPAKLNAAIERAEAALNLLEIEFIKSILAITIEDYRARVSSTATQDELDRYADELNMQVTDILGLNIQDLTAAINSANYIKASVAISYTGDGLDVPIGQWVTEAAMQLLEDAIASASPVPNSALTQGEIDSAAAVLESALAAFTAEIQGDMNFTALQAAIETLHSTIEALPPTYVLTKQRLTTEHSKAEIVFFNATSQTEIDDMVESINAVLGINMKPLELAIIRAEASELSQLLAAIDAAKSVFDDSLSQEDFDYYVRALNHYVEMFLELDSAKAAEALERAYAAADHSAPFLQPIMLGEIEAQKEIIALALTQAELDDAAADLHTLVNASLNLDTTALETAIARAEVAFGLLEQEDQIPLIGGASNAQKAFMTVFNQGGLDAATASLDALVISLLGLNTSSLEAAIAQAEVLLPTLDGLNAMLLDIALANARDALATATTQDELNAALAELNSMLPAVPLDTAALEAAIAQAELLLPTLDGLNAMLLDMALTNAKDVLATATTQEELDDALAELNSRLPAAPLDTSALEAAIAQAEVLLPTLDGLNVMLLDMALTNAKDVLATATTQEELDEALAELNTWLQ